MKRTVAVAIFALLAIGADARAPSATQEEPSRRIHHFRNGYQLTVYPNGKALLGISTGNEYHPIVSFECSNDPSRLGQWWDLATVAAAYNANTGRALTEQDTAVNIQHLCPQARSVDSNVKGDYLLNLNILAADGTEIPVPQIGHQENMLSRP